jgi:hypothetical protein
VVPGGGIKSSLSKGGLKISSMLKNFNADAVLPVLRLFPANSTKMSWGRFRAIWGDFGTCFTSRLLKN